MNQPNIKFDLWPDGAFDEGDVAELSSMISSIEPSVSGEISHDLRGWGDVQATIMFISSAVAIGFFSKIGEDIYEGLKKRFAKVLTKPIEESKQQVTHDLIDGGIIQIDTDVDNIRVCLICLYENEEGIYKFIDKANMALTWLNGRIRDKEINPQQNAQIEFMFVDKKSNTLGWAYTNGKIAYEIKIDMNGKMVKTHSGEI